MYKKMNHSCHSASHLDMKNMYEMKAQKDSPEQLYQGFEKFVNSKLQGKK